MPNFFEQLTGNTSSKKGPKIPTTQFSLNQLSETQQNLATERGDLESYQQAEKEAKQAYDAVKNDPNVSNDMKEEKKLEWVKCMNTADLSRKTIASYEASLKLYNETAK